MGYVLLHPASVLIHHSFERHDFNIQRIVGESFSPLHLPTSRAGPQSFDGQMRHQGFEALPPHRHRINTDMEQKFSAILLMSS